MRGTSKQETNDVPFVHDGSLSTGHSNSTLDMVSRLETMVLTAAPLPVEVIRKQIASALDIMIHLSRMRDRSRRVTEISEVIGWVEGEIVLNPLFVFEEDKQDNTRRLNGKLQPTGQPLHHREKLALAGIALDAAPVGKGVDQFEVERL